MMLLQCAVILSANKDDNSSVTLMISCDVKKGMSTRVKTKAVWYILIWCLLSCPLAMEVAVRLLSIWECTECSPLALTHNGWQHHASYRCGYLSVMRIQVYVFGWNTVNHITIYPVLFVLLSQICKCWLLWFTHYLIARLPTKIKNGMDLADRCA